VKDEEPHALGHITFRWMLQEIHRSGCGILFDFHALQDLGIPSDCIPQPSTEQEPAVSSVNPISAPAPDGQKSASSSSSQGPHPDQTEGSTGFVSFLHKLKLKAKTFTYTGNVQPKETLPEQASKPCADLDATDVLQPIHDQLVANPLWWILQTPIWYPGEILCVSLYRTT
jgi:hypothetical protein